jgi:hypothetical protein
MTLLVIAPLNEASIYVETFYCEYGFSVISPRSGLGALYIKYH